MKLVVFSGGTAMNSIAEELLLLSSCTAHVIPVSDDGGSTAEILRVLGGPAMGDLRSRAIRLADHSTPESSAVKRLLKHRLSKDPHLAKQEWDSIVRGESSLSDGIRPPYRDTIRGFLLQFHTAILQRAQHNFDYSNGSVGNFFFSGARLFFHSLDAALFLYLRVSGVHADCKVLPVIQVDSEARVSLGAMLKDGTLIRGQANISHPSMGRSTIVDKHDAAATQGLQALVVILPINIAT